MDLNTYYTGNIDPAGDVDYFRIYIAQPGRLTVSATNPTGSLMRTYLRMYNLNADDPYVYNYANTGGDDVTLFYNIAEPGTYFLRVHDADNHGGVQYTVSAALETASDPYEPNYDPTHATALNIGDVGTGEYLSRR